MGCAVCQKKRPERYLQSEQKFYCSRCLHIKMLPADLREILYGNTLVRKDLDDRRMRR